MLFKLLNNEICNYHLRLERHHWGEKKIPIRNLIVLTNTKPMEEFQFVKILTVDELIRYVKYFKPIFFIHYKFIRIRIIVSPIPRDTDQ